MDWIVKHDLPLAAEPDGAETLPAFVAASAPTGFRARARRAWKASIDPVLALLLLVVLAPLILTLAALVWRQSGRPVFYGHVRWGQGGRRFRCWKFRTMTPDADARLNRLLEQDAGARAEWAAYAKLKADPRVTPVGQLLRKTSLDELPQLWNVVRGDMSLVGARPIAIGEEWRWGEQFRFYLAEKPGLTGPWQVICRNSGDYRRRLVLHRHYLNRWSPWADAKCLLRTLAVPFIRRNAF